jgi:cyclohexa-1,5-dienecarbonyl-CoA hydratase
MTEEAGLTALHTADGTRATLTMYHAKGNIITDALIHMMDVSLDRLAPMQALRLLTVEARGPDFSFGASIPEHAPGEIERVLPKTHALVRKLLAFPSPTAALVRGRCLGGGFELALACDFIFAEEGATFGLPEIALGVFPPAACALLPARVGTARATAAIVTGAPISGGDWHAAGLVTSVSRAGELAADVDRWFDANLRGRSAEALRHAVAGARLRLRQDVAALLPQLERLYLDGLMHTADAREGVAAFLGKRPPVWNDR